MTLKASLCVELKRNPLPEDGVPTQTKPEPLRHNFQQQGKSGKWKKLISNEY